MIINKQHEYYINNDVLINFIRDNKVKATNFRCTTESMIKVINEYALISDQNEKKLKEAINEWLEQGRKKILYRYLEDELNFGVEIELIKQNIRSKFELIDEKNLSELVVPSNDRELWNIDFVVEDNCNIKVKFLYVEKLIKKVRDEEFIDVALPVIVVLDIFEKEIYVTVPGKSDLYRDVENKVEDIKVAEEILEEVIQTLGLDRNISVTQNSELKSILYSIHKEITELPEEIIKVADDFNDEINGFIEDVTTKIDMLNNELNKEDMFNGIKNVILKNIISTYEDCKIFEDGKYAISTGLDGSGATKSLFRFNSSAKEPVQSKPEYQDIRSIMSVIEQIKRDVLLWNSVRTPSIKIRMKMYAHNRGYIQICFEQYVWKEDIDNVLSKIRSFKANR